MAYLREKNDMAQKWKAEELELQKQRLEVESKQQDESRKQRQEMMQMMAQQVRQQQNQMQQFQQMFAAMQQQQSQIILKLSENLNLLRVVERTTTGFIASFFVQIKRPFDHIFV